MGKPREVYKDANLTELENSTSQLAELYKGINPNKLFLSE